MKVLFLCIYALFDGTLKAEAAPKRLIHKEKSKWIFIKSPWASAWPLP